jgi:hypothetical protein
VNQRRHSEATLGRLLAVDWKADFLIRLGYARSRGKLMQEYLRRAAWWAQGLDATGQWPFFDIAGLVEPGLHAPPELAEQLEIMIHDRIGWPSLRVTCRAALRWAALLDTGIPVPPHLEDPFEPLLLMFERGGGFITEHGFIDLGASAVPQKTWRDHLAPHPIISLDQAALDALDQPEETARPERPN